MTFLEALNLSVMLHKRYCGNLLHNVGLHRSNRLLRKTMKKLGLSEAIAKRKMQNTIAAQPSRPKNSWSVTSTFMAKVPAKPEADDGARAAIAATLADFH